MLCYLSCAFPKLSLTLRTPKISLLTHRVLRRTFTPALPLPPQLMSPQWAEKRLSGTKIGELPPTFKGEGVVVCQMQDIYTTFVDENLIKDVRLNRRTGITPALPEQNPHTGTILFISNHLCVERPSLKMCWTWAGLGVGMIHELNTGSVRTLRA